MSSPPDETWIKLAGGRSWLAIRANGAPDHGSPALVRCQTVSCSGERGVHLRSVDAFDDALKVLHDTLKGEAHLESWEGDFELTIRSFGKTGHLMAEAVLSERCGNDDEFELRFNIPLDQSHIPAFRADLAKHFPRATT